MKRHKTRESLKLVVGAVVLLSLGIVTDSDATEIEFPGVSSLGVDNFGRLVIAEQRPKMLEQMEELYILVNDKEPTIELYNSWLDVPALELKDEISLYYQTWIRTKDRYK